jgi:hypothetical protein
MTNKPAERRAQEPSDNTSQNPAVEVGDGATRYDWSIAFSRMCMRKEYPAIAIAAAMRLVEYPARGTGQCDAKRITIANELGVSERHLNRGLKVLKDDGWIRLQRGGPEDPVTITLLIPAEDVDIHHFGANRGKKGTVHVRKNQQAQLSQDRKKQSRSHVQGPQAALQQRCR